MSVGLDRAGSKRAERPKGEEEDGRELGWSKLAAAEPILGPDDAQIVKRLRVAGDDGGEWDELCQVALGRKAEFVLEGFEGVLTEERVDMRARGDGDDVGRSDWEKEKPKDDEESDFDDDEDAGGDDEGQEESGRRHGDEESDFGEDEEEEGKDEEGREEEEGKDEDDGRKRGEEEDEEEEDDEDEGIDMSRRAPWISEIQLTNFMNHANLHVKFKPGVNFIIGENGSGKSAICAAIQTGLAASSGATGRGTNADMIRHGTDRAVVSITIANEGPMAFEKETLGDKFTIERTLKRYRSGAGSEFRILNNKGEPRVFHKDKHQKPTTKAPAQFIRQLLDTLRIDTSNPLTVITQQGAKEFAGQGPAYKYDVFVRACGLRSLRDKVEQAEATYKQLKASEREIRQRTKDLKRKWDKKQAALNEMKEFQEANERMVQLEERVKWSLVQEAGQKVQKIDEEKEEARKLFEDMVKKQESVEVKMTKARKRRELALKAVNENAREQDAAADDAEEESEAVKGALDRLRRLDSEVKMAEKEVRSKQRALSRAEGALEKQLATEAKDTVTKKLESARRKLREAEGRLPDAETAVRKAEEMVERLVKGEEEASAEYGEARSKQQEVEARLATVQGQLTMARGDRGSRDSGLGVVAELDEEEYGEHSRTVLAQTQMLRPEFQRLRQMMDAACKEGRLSVRPLGPLTRHLILGDDDPTSMRALSASAGSDKYVFVAASASDAKVILDLARGNPNLTITTLPPGRSLRPALDGVQLPRGVTPLIDCVTIPASRNTNPENTHHLASYEATAIFDIFKIDRDVIVRADTGDEAVALARQVVRDNTSIRRAYVANGFVQAFNAGASDLFIVDRSGQSAELERLEHSLGGEVEVWTSRAKAARHTQTAATRRRADAEREAKDASRTLSDLRRQVGRYTVEVRDLEDSRVAEDGESELVTELRLKVQDAKSAVEDVERGLQTLVRRHDKAAADHKAKEATYKAAEREARERRHKAAAAAAAAEKEREAAEKEVQQMGRRLEEWRERLDEAVNRAKAFQEERAAAKKTAKEMYHKTKAECKVVLDIPEDIGSPEEETRALETCRAQREKYKRELAAKGLNAEIVASEAAAAEAEYTEAYTNEKFHRKRVERGEIFIKDALEDLRRSRQRITDGINKVFSDLMRFKGHEGRILIEHERAGADSEGPANGTLNLSVIPEFHARGDMQAGSLTQAQGAALPTAAAPSSSPSASARRRAARAAASKTLPAAEEADYDDEEDEEDADFDIKGYTRRRRKTTKQTSAASAPSGLPAELADTTDTGALSGGERSFSTLAFVLAATANIPDMPFQIMDEFDIFMDEETRSMALTKILHHAGVDSTGRQARSINRSHGSMVGIIGPGARQYIFITPHDISAAVQKSTRDISIFKLKPPRDA